MAYASAAAMEETTVIDFNRRRCSQHEARRGLPEDGSFFSDSPFIVLNAPWVSPAKRQAADALQKLPRRRDRRRVGGPLRLPPRRRDGKPAGLVSAANGADPAQPGASSRCPSRMCSTACSRTWRRDRKPANVELVLDNSGSMSDEDKLEHAKQGLQAFFRQVAPQDEIGLTKFSDEGHASSSRRRPFASNRGALAAAVRDIIPEDDTALYDATVYGGRRDQVARRRRAHQRRRGPHRRRRTRTSSRSAQQVLDALRAGGQGREQRVRVFTIAYGSDAKEGELERFADASGGKGFTGLHRRHRAGLPVDLVLLLDGRPTSSSPATLWRAARGQRGDQAAEHRRAGVLLVVGIVLTRGRRSPCRSRSSPTSCSCAQTFFDSEEAERVARRPTRARAASAPRSTRHARTPRSPRRWSRRARPRRRSAQAMAEADHPFDDVAADVDALVARDGDLGAARAAHRHDAGRPGARRAGRRRPRADDHGPARAPPTPDVHALLADLEAQRDATARLEDRLERFEVGMQRICASLGLLRTRLAEMSASEEEAAQRELARQSRELRERTDLLAESMAEVFADDDNQQVELPVAEHRPDG